MARVISSLLVAGVAVGAVFVALGLALLYFTRETGCGAVESNNLLAAGAVESCPRDIAGVLTGASAFKPLPLVQLGLLVLIATPVFRVAASIVVFALDRDILYVVITAAVLAILLVSLLALH